MSNFKFEAWPTEYISINQYFGANPQNYHQFGLPGHEGVDIMAPNGSKVFAVAAGTVSRVYPYRLGHNYGIHVRVDHIDGFQTIYAHLESVSVTVRQSVQAGTQLGLADDTGNSFGAHLHLTLKRIGHTYKDWPRNIFDPTPYLLPLMGWQIPSGPYVEGWAYTAGLFILGDLAQVNAGGINLREQANINGRKIGLVPGGTLIIVTGEAERFYTPVRVARAAIPELPPTPPPSPSPPPPPTVTTIDGWGFSNYLTINGDQAVIGQFGINLRASPSRAATNIGLVRGNSTATIIGTAQGEYTPIRVRRTDFQGPLNLPTPPPVVTPGTVTPPANSYLGWAWSQYLSRSGRQAIIGRFGINLRNRPQRTGQNIGLVKGGATVAIVGPARGEYTPIFAHKRDVLNAATPMPTIELPEPFPDDPPPPPPQSPPPAHDTTPGWAFSAQIQVSGTTAVAGQYGINLRAAPYRNANNLGFVPARSPMIVTGSPQGEYTPVRVNDDVLQPIFDPTNPPPDPMPLGNAKIGLHAAADPTISDAEVAEFAAMRPGMIKLLSFHDPSGIRKLVQAHPDASWIVRTFLDFGGRTIQPQQFFDDTIDDTQRTLNLLQGKDVVIELHNEPNLVSEGLQSSWANGTAFATWWLTLLDLYRQALPNYRYLYPGLSPGSSVSNIKHDHIQFIEASRAAVAAADGLGVHLYWSRFYAMDRALAVLDDYISRFRFKPIWVTEASNNRDGVTATRKGVEYLQFWRELQKRPTVQGVTYFVASASNPQFRHEVWVGRNIGRVIGRR